MKHIMTTARTGMFLMVALGVFACSPKPATPVKYDKKGVSFTHLSDWTVTGDALIEGSDGWRSVELEGPHDAIMSIIIMPAAAEMTLQTYAGEFARERAVEIKQVLTVGPISPATVSSTKSEETIAQVGGASRKGIMHTFSVELLGEKVPHKATFFMVTGQDRKAYIYTQASTEDLASVTPGINVTLASFRLN